jgi:[ribosomal protein S5]-alanine N-acetyltransferase
VITATPSTLAVWRPSPSSVVTSDWKEKLPVLSGLGVTLRELRASDAPTLLAMMTTEEVSRFISPPPTTIDGFERFIDWTHRERRAGRYVCFGVIPDGHEHAVGLFQIRVLEPSLETAEWGFAIGSAFWGTGLFTESARSVLEFCFGVVGIRRVEARACLENGRGNGALQKVGAVREGLLRKSFLRNGKYYDQVLWSIVADEWELRDTDVVRH